MGGILLIDAEQPFSDQIVRRPCKGRGFTVKHLDDGKDGLDYARDNRPDLIVLCVELPKMSGYSICNKLKKDNDLKGIPLIITSKEATPRDVRAAQEAEDAGRGLPHQALHRRLTSSRRSARSSRCPPGRPPTRLLARPRGAAAPDELGLDAFDARLRGSSMRRPGRQAGRRGHQARDGRARRPGGDAGAAVRARPRRPGPGRRGRGHAGELDGLGDGNKDESLSLDGLDLSPWGASESTRTSTWASTVQDEGCRRLRRGLRGPGAPPRRRPRAPRHAGARPAPARARGPGRSRGRQPVREAGREARRRARRQRSARALAVHVGGRRCRALAAAARQHGPQGQGGGAWRRASRPPRSAQKSSQAALSQTQPSTSSGARDVLNLKEQLRAKDKEIGALKDEVFEKEKANVDLQEETDRVKAEASGGKQALASKDVEIASLAAKVAAVTEQRDELEEQIQTRLAGAEAGPRSPPGRGGPGPGDLRGGAGEGQGRRRPGPRRRGQEQGRPVSACGRGEDAKKMLSAAKSASDSKIASRRASRAGTKRSATSRRTSA